MWEGSILSTPSPAFIIYRLFNDGHSDRWEWIPPCTFGLRFSKDQWYWASFQLSVGHLWVFLRKMSVQVLCPSLIRLLVVFSCCWVLWGVCIVWVSTLYWWYNFCFSGSPFCFCRWFPVLWAYLVLRNNLFTYGPCWLECVIRTLSKGETGLSWRLQEGKTRLYSHNLRVSTMGRMLPPDKGTWRVGLSLWEQWLLSYVKSK